MKKAKKIKTQNTRKRESPYVSLYGIKETEEIPDYYIWNYEKLWKIKMTKTGRFLKNTLSDSYMVGPASKIVSDVIKDSEKGIDIENIINKISTGFSLKNCIFIFDDLERTSCNVNDILGYINNFIEHDQVKVLLSLMKLKLIQLPDLM